MYNSILRIFFWLGKRFDTTLLFQSVAMLIAMVTLLKLVVQYKSDNPFEPLMRHESNHSSSASSYSSLSSSQPSHDIVTEPRRLTNFWDWDNFEDYVKCLLGFTTAIGILYVVLHQYDWFIETLGFVSLGIESTLPLPQLLTNLKNKSTNGFSLLILASWFFGDGFKAFYFVFQHSPFQFILCSFIQLTFDSLIVVEFIVFSSWFKRFLLGKVALEDEEVQIA
ncbi:MAG: hypothetical protein EXX96DRAFT_595060 [Benjaminiella poitrasii]|nr:MAG: hypothetical protein EXX96DRAFT_595060 [Benjaminiella poitrasii]